MTDTTSAATLRAAATLLRATYRNVPISVRDQPGWDHGACHTDDLIPVTVMHPGVGLALADWLETTATYYAPGPAHPTHVVHALAVARQILGTTGEQPAPAVDRAAILREAAGRLAELRSAEREWLPATGLYEGEQELRRMADEVEHVATPCDFVACEPGGEPCSTHERLMAHADGEHELCGPDCQQPAVAQPEPHACPSPDNVQVWPLQRVLTEVRCGSQDWTWEEEWADLDRRHAETGYLARLEQQIKVNGITMPVLIGSDGRLWDGHHRLCIAVRLGIGYVPVEVVPPGTRPEPTVAEAQTPTFTHACPTDGSGLTPCCRRTPFEIGRTHRLTRDPALVTCPGTPAPEDPS